MKIYRTSIGNFTIADIVATIAFVAALFIIAALVCFGIYVMAYGL